MITLFVPIVSGLLIDCYSWYSGYLKQKVRKFKLITEEQNATLNPPLLSVSLQLVFFFLLLHCALVVVFWSFLHDISLSPTDYWETRQAFNLLKGPILNLST